MIYYPYLPESFRRSTSPGHSFLGRTIGFRRVAIRERRRSAAGPGARRRRSVDRRRPFRDSTTTHADGAELRISSGDTIKNALV